MNDESDVSHFQECCFMIKKNEHDFITEIEFSFRLILLPHFTSLHFASSTQNVEGDESMMVEMWKRNETKREEKNLV